MLLAATLPSVLFCIVTLTALVTFAVLLYIRANKKDNPTAKSSGDCGPKATKEIKEVYYTTVKSNSNDGQKATKEIEEVYYSTIDLSTCAVDPQMEKNCAYGDICIHRMAT